MSTFSGWCKTGAKPYLMQSSALVQNPGAKPTSFPLGKEGMGDVLPQRLTPYPFFEKQQGFCTTYKKLEVNQ